ncbi:MAG TPA: hypothetical protein VHU90_12950, partial [Galbitalea sp.]|nr:hypothetical protein [Galbitalea sp.]
IVDEALGDGQADAAAGSGHERGRAVESAHWRAPRWEKYRRSANPWCGFRPVGMFNLRQCQR